MKETTELNDRLKALGIPIEDRADPEFSRREELRRAASPDEWCVKDPTLGVDNRKGVKR